MLLDASDPRRFVSRKTAEDFVGRLAGAFEPGTTVCLHLPNDILYPVLVLGILASKCRWTGSNPAHTQYELAHHFRVSNTKYVVTLQEHLTTVETAVRELGSEIEIILFTDLLRKPAVDAACESWSSSAEKPQTDRNRNAEMEKYRTLEDMCSPPHSQKLQDQIQHELTNVPLDDIAVLQSTSGTTGLPKMAVRTHEAMMLETIAIEDNNAAKPYEVRRLFCTPIFHAFSTPEMIFNPLRLGYTAYFMRRFDESFAQKIHDFGITETAAPPPMLMRLEQQTEAHHLLQSLRLTLSGGAPLMPGLRTRVLRIFNNPPRIVQVWGMTEGGWFTTLKYPDDDDTGSVGRIIPGLDITVSAEDVFEAPTVARPENCLSKALSC